MNNHHEPESPSWTRDPPVNNHSDIHPWILKATIRKWAHRCANLHVIASLPAGIEGWSWPVGRRQPRAGRCRERRRNSQCNRIPEMGKVSWNVLINKISSSSKRASLKHYTIGLFPMCWRCLVPGRRPLTTWRSLWRSLARSGRSRPSSPRWVGMWNLVSHGHHCWFNGLESAC